MERSSDMADQVGSTGGLAQGLPLPLVVASAPKPASESPRLSKPGVLPVQGQSRPSAPGTAKTSEAAMEQVNGHLQETGSELKFQVDQGTGRTIFKVVNPSSGEVILQVPSEEMLALARNLRSLEKQAGASGVLVDKEG
jgi:flagellar protein FlaG